MYTTGILLSTVTCNGQYFDIEFLYNRMEYHHQNQACRYVAVSVTVGFAIVVLAVAVAALAVEDGYG